MKARRFGGATFSVASFYRTTWQLLIILTGMLAIFAQVVRPWVALPAFAVSFLLVTPFGLALGSKRRLVSVAVTTLLLGLAMEQVLRIHRLEDFIQGMIEMICGALSLLLLRSYQARTYWLAILTVVIIAVGSISLTSSPLVYGLFLLQTGCVLLNLNAAQLYMQEQQGRRPTEPLPSGYLMQFLLVMPLGTVSALLIFLAFPRVTSFTMALTQNLVGHRTGYSGLVNLSGGGELQESLALAFMVESDDRDWLEANAGSLLFRGDSLDVFDGQRWTNSVFNFRGAAATDLRLARQHTRNIHLLTVHLEPSPLATIFYPEILLGVTPLQPSALHVLVNGNGSLSRDIYTMERVTYDLRTVTELDDGDLPSTPLADIRHQIETAAGSGDEGSVATLTPLELRSYLEIPAQIREAPYFKAWLTELGVDPRKADVATLQRRLVQLFTSKFTPTLANSFHQKDALAAFLGDQRAGHCEYFATSTVLTLRAMGVPARVVVGYFGGTFNDLVGALEVRDDDAHAWVEAYVPGVGWHTFNPTPPVPRAAATSFAAMLRLYANATSFWLRRYLVDYDQSTQRSLLHSLQELAPKREPTSDMDWPWAQQYGRSLGLLACLGVLFWWLGQLWRSQRAPMELPRYYRRFLARQLRAGPPRLTGETFAAYHRRLRAVLPDPSELDAIDERLQLDLYGPPALAAVQPPVGLISGTDVE